MDKSQKHSTEQENPDLKKKKRVHTVRFHLYEILEEIKLIYSDRKQISDCLGPRVHGRLGCKGK